MFVCICVCVCLCVCVPCSTDSRSNTISVLSQPVHCHNCSEPHLFIKAYYTPPQTHTHTQVYRLPDLRLVRVLPSAEDEVNAACFHPVPGGGLAYGTKEGRLRVLRHEPFAARRRCEEELTETSMTSDASDEDHVW